MTQQLKLTIDCTNAYLLALNVAEQGGIFSAMRFRANYPDAESYSGQMTISYLATEQTEEKFI